MGILALTADERVTAVRFTKDTLSVALRDGRTITVPLAWYPRLLNASAAEQRRVGGVDDGVGGLLDNVGRSSEFERLAAGESQSGCEVGHSGL